MNTLIDTLNAPTLTRRAAILLACFSVGIVAVPAAAQTLNTETLTVGSVESTNSIVTLRLIQAKVREVVSKTMPACVHVTDDEGAGSGVIVSPDGLVLTAGHVMASQRTYSIVLPSGRRLTAKPLGKNLNVDAAMLQIIEPGPWPHVELADNMPQIGDWTVTIAHSGGWELGRNPPVRTGRVLEKRGFQMVTDAVLIGGDSGGPLFDLDGKLIGINSSIGETIAENRHITIDTFRQHWSRMLAGNQWGKLPSLDKPEEVVKRAKIGVRIDKRQNDGRITRVVPGSPADIVGIRAGDKVIEFDGERIRQSTQLINLIKQKEPGEVCSISVERSGVIHRFMIHLKQID